MTRMDGKTALVTGAGRGIGRAIAIGLAARGARVAVHYGRNADAAAETVARIESDGGSAFAVRARLGVDSDAAELFAAFDAAADGKESGLDILVNNAGANGPGPIDTADVTGYDEVMDLNVKAPFFITQRALPRLRDGGRIVNISSGAQHAAWPNDPAYAMSKAALDALTRALAVRLAPRGITVNTVAPGVIDTDMNASWLRDDPAGMERGARPSVFNRVGQPRDVADVVAFIASDDARWMTGQFVDATGGSLLVRV